MNSLKETLAFIKNDAHAGVTDKSGAPYWKHPVAVMGNLPANVSDDVRHAALLHDVVEDTHYTAADLQKMGYNGNVIKMVMAVTKDKADGMTYQERIEALIAGGNVGAMQIKLADNMHNMDPRRSFKIKDSLMKRYVASSDALKKALGV